MASTLAPSATRTPARVLVAVCATELLSLGALIVAISIGLSLQINRHVESSWSPETVLSWVTAWGAAAAMVAQFAFGWLSDRATRIWGWTRSPWIIGGAVTGLIALVLVSRAHTVGSLTLTWMLAQTTYNATFAGLYGTMADLIQPHDRMRVSAWFSASTTACLFVVLGVVHFLPFTPFVLFQMTGIAALVSATASVLLLRGQARADVGKPTRPEQPGDPAAYWLLFAQRLLAQTAYSGATFLSVFYLMRRVGVGATDAAGVTSGTTPVAALAGIGAALVGGQIARRFGPIRVMTAGLIVFTAGLVILTWGTSTTSYVAAALLVGIGFAGYGPSDLALILDSSPTSHAGRYLGFFNVARTIPQSLAPAVAPLLLGLGTDRYGVDRSHNYFMFYVVCALIALVSLIPLAGLARHRQGQSRESSA